MAGCDMSGVPEGASGEGGAKRAWMRSFLGAGWDVWGAEELVLLLLFFCSSLGAPWRSVVFIARGGRLCRSGSGGTGSGGGRCGGADGRGDWP